jgi:hypothetical protein
MRKALVIGIDYYKKKGSSLNGCVNDAYAVKNVLERHADGTLNYGVELLTASSKSSQIKRNVLKEKIENLFNYKGDVVLYFSGHGYIEDTGGFLVSSECKTGDDGLSLDTVLKIANKSKAKSKVIILDCCHSGYAGSVDNSGKVILSKDMTILTASSENQYAVEKNATGVFTTLLVDALNGGAADILGRITPGSVYAHIDRSLGPWSQRPLFKTNVEDFITLRNVQPKLSLDDLQRITSLFNHKEDLFDLDPSYEPTTKIAIKSHTEQFEILQKYVSVNLVIPIGAKHMYYAAMESKQCTLTPLGQHYWYLVKQKRI